jgi:hypothetical protein
MRFHTVRYGIADQTQSGMQLASQSLAVESHNAMIHVYDAAGKLIEVHRYKGDFKEP